ncbi:MAG: hypothetical protein BGO59_23410 [Spirosoma sp. 48-14]|nr:MAG: hypothetical protein BGO59_23410 [Spirosoma sp. 48-14]
MELVAFSGQPTDKTIELTWATSWEDKNEGFDILRGRTPDGLEKIGYVEGHSSTQAVSAYSFTDRDVEAGRVYYYRLLQRDMGGGSALSKIIDIRAGFGMEMLGASVYPNPNHGCFTVSANNLELSTVSLYDALGTLIPVTFRQDERPTSTSVNVVGHLAPGVYFLRLQTNGETTKQIIKVIIE